MTWEISETLKIPAGALFRRGEEWATFVLEEGRARSRPVKVGRSDGKEVQVLDGLKDGQTVILYPGDRVRDGQKVKAITI